MYQLKMMGWVGLIAGVIGLLNYFFGVRDERSVGLVVFIAGSAFLAAALAARAVINELRREEL
jgi:hypothetical protein